MQFPAVVDSFDDSAMAQSHSRSVARLLGPSSPPAAEPMDIYTQISLLQRVLQQRTRDLHLRLAALPVLRAQELTMHSQLHAVLLSSRERVQELEGAYQAILRGRLPDAGVSQHAAEMARLDADIVAMRASMRGVLQAGESGNASAPVSAPASASASTSATATVSGDSPPPSDIADGDGDGDASDAARYRPQHLRRFPEDSAVFQRHEALDGRYRQVLALKRKYEEYNSLLKQQRYEVQRELDAKLAELPHIQEEVAALEADLDANLHQVSELRAQIRRVCGSIRNAAAKWQKEHDAGGSITSRLFEPTRGARADRGAAALDKTPAKRLPEASSSSSLGSSSASQRGADQETNAQRRPASKPVPGHGRRAGSSKGPRGDANASGAAAGSSKADKKRVGSRSRARTVAPAADPDPELRLVTVKPLGIVSGLQQTTKRE
jgi:hypothetical protein